MSGKRVFKKQTKKGRVILDIRKLTEEKNSLLDLLDSTLKEAKAEN